MSNIYSARFMNEASTLLADKVIKKPVTETYLFSTINILREMNNEIDNKTKQLYISIAEAESKDAENKLFANYFYEFKNIFEKFSDRVNQMKSRMVMAIENKVETWDELTKDDSYITDFDKEFSYSGWKFPSIQNPNYPRLNLQKTYQKEFDYLGMLMQDKSIEVSPSAKMKIIATVTNNFTNYTNNENWIKDVIKDMVDIDDKDISDSYSQCLYNALREKCELNVDKGVVYTCRDNLCNYEDIIDACTKMCDCLLCDVAKVAENISSYLFRNEDKKLKIKTETDGVIDRDYRLDTYSMNQLDLFLKNKCNEMRKILNIYSIAIGIKFDTAVDYIDQCIDILKAVKGYDDDENMETSDMDENPDTEMDNDVENQVPEDDDSLDGDESEEEEVPMEPEEDDNEVELSPYKKLETSSMPEDDDDDDMSDDSIDDLDDDDEPESKGVVVDDDTEEFEEAYLFESELFELEMLSNMHYMHEAVARIVLNEEGEGETAQQPTTSEPAKDGDGKTAENKDTTSNVQKLANKAKEPNIIQKLINKIKELWKKFKEFFTTNSGPKIEYLKKNRKFLDTKITGKIGLDYTADLQYLDKIKLQDLNYEAMKGNLESEDKFAKTFTSFYPDNNDGLSISEYIKKTALGEPQEATENLDKVTPSVTRAYDFCVNYPNKVQALDRQMQMLEKAERVLQQQLKESANFNDYFSEADLSQDTSKESKEKELSVYFRVSSQIIAAQMTVYQKLFNEFYIYCKWWITKAGGSSDDATKEGGNKNNNQEGEKKPEQPAKPEGQQ